MVCRHVRAFQNLAGLYGYRYRYREGNGYRERKRYSFQKETDKEKTKGKEKAAPGCSRRRHPKEKDRHSATGGSSLAQAPYPAVDLACDAVPSLLDIPVSLDSGEAPTEVRLESLKSAKKEPSQRNGSLKSPKRISALAELQGLGATPAKHLDISSPST